MKKKGNIVIALGLLLMTAALSLFLYNIWDGLRAEKASQEIAEDLIDAIKDADIEDAVDPFSARSEESPAMPTVEIDGYQYIGFLRIPSLDLTLPVMADWDYERLKVSPCRYTGSYYDDDLVICAHNYARHFSPIRSIDISTDVYFTTAAGTEIHYIVSNRETVQPTSIDEMIGNQHNESGFGDWDMTLFTCNTGGQTRCAVRCIKVEE